MRVKLEDVCKRIYAGGDVPKDRYSEVKTDEYSVPIYANAEKDEGLYGYTDKAREKELSITVAARGTIGFTSIRREPFLPVVRLITVVPDTKKVSERYLYYVLKNCKSYSTGTSIPQLTVPDIKKKSFELCNIPEQEEIADRLDKANEIIQLRKKELQLLEDLIKARFVELFGDLKTNSKGWQIVGFKECADIDTNMIHDFEEYEDYPHIGIDSIEKETGNLVGYRTVAEDGIISGKYLFTPAHIIYSKIRPNLNKVAMPEFMGLCSADAYPILVKKGVCNREYFGYTLRSNYFLDYILAFSNRTNLPKVNKNQVEGFTLPLPPIDLQNQFAAFVQRIDKSKLLSLIKLLEQLITYLYNVFIIYRQDKGEEVEDHE